MGESDFDLMVVDLPDPQGAIGPRQALTVVCIILN